jgi:hypothetical protein
MTDLELVKLYMRVKGWGGWWDILISDYRRRTGSKATDASLRAELSKRIGEIRWRLERVLGRDRAFEFLPKLPRPPKNNDRFREAFEWLITDALKQEEL